MNDVVLVRHASASAATSGPSRRHMIAGSVLKVYTTLQRLERDGLVEAGGHGEGAQKGYRLTAPGRTELLGWLQRPSGDDAPPRDELLIMVLVAVQVSEVDVHEVIQTHRRHLIETMQRYTAVRVATDAGDVALALVVDAELFRIEGAVRWIDTAEVRLASNPVLRPAATPAETTAPSARAGRRAGVRR